MRRSLCLLRSSVFDLFGVAFKILRSVQWQGMDLGFSSAFQIRVLLAGKQQQTYKKQCVQFSPILLNPCVYDFGHCSFAMSLWSTWVFGTDGLECCDGEANTLASSIPKAGIFWDVHLCLRIGWRWQSWPMPTSSCLPTRFICRLHSRAHGNLQADPVKASQAFYPNWMHGTSKKVELIHWLVVVFWRKSCVSCFVSLAEGRLVAYHGVHEVKGFEMSSTQVKIFVSWFCCEIVSRPSQSPEAEALLTAR